MLAVGTGGKPETVASDRGRAGGGGGGGGRGDPGSSTQPLAGGELGLATAIVLGMLIYKGSVKLDLGRFFRWTGGFLVFVAAGVLSYGIHDLQEAGILPGLDSIAFDVSSTIPPGSWYATLLKGTVNFSPRTTWLELLAWVSYVVPALALFILTVRPARPAALTPSIPAPATS